MKYCINPPVARLLDSHSMSGQAVLSIFLNFVFGYLTKNISYAIINKYITKWRARIYLLYIELTLQYPQVQRSELCPANIMGCNWGWWRWGGRWGGGRWGVGRWWGGRWGCGRWEDGRWDGGRRGVVSCRGGLIVSDVSVGSSWRLFIWFLRLLGSIKASPQISHLCRLSPVCLLTCMFICCLCVNLLPQWGHWNFLIP